MSFSGTLKHASFFTLMIEMAQGMGQGMGRRLAYQWSKRRRRQIVRVRGPSNPLGC